MASLLCRFSPRIGSAYRWAVADFLNYADKYGETPKFAELLGLSDQTVYDWCYIARKVETSGRHDVLSFSHHKEIAPLTPNDQAQ